MEWDLLLPVIFNNVEPSTVALTRLLKVMRLARASRLIHRLT